MKKVNFDGLKNISTPQNFIDNALNIPSQPEKPLPFVIKHSRAIAAAACLILVCTVSLTVYFTQDRIVPPVDPDYVETQESTTNTSDTHEQDSTAPQTETKEDTQKEDETSAQNTNGNEPSETQSSTTTATTSNTVTNQNSSQTGALQQNGVIKPYPTTSDETPVHSNSVSNPKPQPTPATEPTEKPVVKPTQTPTTKPTVKPTQPPETEATEPTAPEPTEKPIVVPTQRPTSEPAKLSLPTIPPRAPQPTESIEPLETLPPEPLETMPTENEINAVTPTVNPTVASEYVGNETEAPTDEKPQQLYIKADGTTYKVEQGQVYQYTFYLTVPSVKVSGIIASTYYDTDGLEVVIPTTKYGYDDLNAIFPIFGENTTANLRGLNGELRYLYGLITGAKLHSEDCVVMTIGFRVTASSGVYEINTFIEELVDTDLNKFVWNNEIVNDDFSTRFVLSTPPQTPEQKPTSPEQDEPEYDINLIPNLHCPLEMLACVGHTKEFDLSDEIFCGVYDYRMNLIGDEDYYADTRRASAYDLEDSSTEFVYYPGTYDYITEVDSYFYCFYNTQGDILYWARLHVY